MRLEVRDVPLKCSVLSIFHCKGTRFQVVSVCNFQSISPGLVKSNIFNTCLGADIHDSVYKQPSLDPDDVASAIEYALSAPTHVQVSSIDFWFIYMSEGYCFCCCLRGGVAQGIPYSVAITYLLTSRSEF